jgi:endonuclease G
MRSGNSAALPAVFAAVLVLSATQSKPPLPPHARPAVFTRYQLNAPRTASEKSAIKSSCGFGLPRRRSGALLGPTRLVYRDGYVLEHSSELRIPLWVCERIQKADLTGPVTGRWKPEPFKPDPDLARWPRAELNDYGGSGYARGHMVPDADRSATKEAKAQTYYLSNMVPQAGQQFNSSVWLTLEKRVRAWACTRGECWVVTGVLIHDPKEETTETADGVVQYYTIGNGPVGIPTHLFKIVLSKPDSGSDVEALAFVFENKFYDACAPLEDFLRSVEYIQERAGFDFFPDMSQKLAETVLHATPDKLWPASDECGQRSK